VNLTLSFPLSRSRSRALSLCVCALRQVCPAGSERDGDTCTACAVGKYKIIQGSEACTDCGSGKYSNFVAATSCQTCPANANAPQASNEQTDCICNSGFTGSDGGNCTACVAGKYKSSLGSASCSNCPSSTFSATSGASVCASCDCPSGQVRNGCGGSSGPGVCEAFLTESVRMVVSLPMTEAEFDDVKRQAFKEALARAAGPNTRTDHISIVKVETINIDRRRLLAPGIRVDVSVDAADKSAADAIAARLTEEDINSELERAGLPAATLLEAATVVEKTTLLRNTVKLVVSLPMTEAEFDDAKQQAFKEALARTAGPSTRTDHISIVKVEAINIARRRLLAPGIRVDVSVSAEDRNAADAIAARLTEEDINIELERAGLPPVTLLEVATVVEDENTPNVLPLGGAGATVGAAFAGAVLFAGVAAWVVRSKEMFRKDSPAKKINGLYLVDCFDTLFDWASWVSATLEGDLEFANDEGGLVSTSLVGISIVGTVLFFWSTYSTFWLKKRYKYVVVAQLGLENAFQAILYVMVATSQSGSTRASVMVGIIQGVLFCFAQIYEVIGLVDEGDEAAGREEMGTRSNGGRSQNESTGTTNKQATATLGAPGPGVPQRPPQARVNTNNPMGPYAMGHAGQPIARF
jgi:hypothetical protein